MPKAIKLGILGLSSILWSRGYHLAPYGKKGNSIVKVASETTASLFIRRLSGFFFDILVLHPFKSLTLTR
jgi:hypothetical protein